MDRFKAHLFVIGSVLLTLCPHAWAAALPFGQTQTGTISSAGQSDSYTFSAAANDVVDFTVVATSGSLSPKIRLYNAAGAQVSSAYGNNGYNQCGGTSLELNTVTLTAAGTYTVLLGDCNDVNSGNYAIYLQRTNNPAGAIALPFGPVQTGTISAVTQSNSYTFSASANDVVDFTVVATSGSLSPKIRLYNSAGAQVGYAYGNNGYNQCGGTSLELNTVTLTAAGTYTVLLGDCNDANSGNYAIYLQRTNNPAGSVALPFGPVQTGTISAVTQSNSYTFSASANDVVDFTVVATSGSLSPKIRLYNSAGAQVGYAYGNNGYNQCGGTSLELNTVTLTAAGTYTVLLGDCNDANSGNYAIYLQRTNNPAGAIALPFGPVQTGTISAVTQSNSYTFSASANDVVDFTVVATSGSLSPKIRLYNSAGAQVGYAYGNNGYNQCGGTSLELNTVTLTAAGTYTVLLGDCNDANSGNYAIYLQRTNNPAGSVALPFGPVQTGAISAVTQSNSYTFSASANDVVDFTVVATSGSLSPKIRLYNSAGAQVGYAYGNNGYNQCGGTSLELNTVTLTAAGTYTVLLGDCNDANSGNYAIYLQRTNNPAGSVALPFGPVQTGTISAVTQSNSYTFSGAANDVVNFTVAATGGSLSPKLRLYNSAGAQVGYAYGNNGYNQCGGSSLELNNIKLPAAGSYAVLIGDCNDTNTGKYNLSAQCIGVCPSTASPVITTSSLPNGIVNQPYGPVTMAASGGSGNYSWSVTGAPAGVSLSPAGILSGTPTAMGTFSLSISLTSGGTTVSATLPMTVTAPPPPKPIVLLTRTADDATVDYFSNLLTTAGLPFTTLTAAQVNASNIANTILIAGFSSEPTEFKGVATLINNAVSGGSWLICEAYGVYLPSYSGVGSVSTSSTDPVVLDHHAFVKPVDSSGALLFNGIATWDPPALPDEPAQYTAYYLQTGEYGVVAYNPPPNTNIFSYWGLTLTYGWNFQATNSAYCQSWGGCTGERSVAQGSLYLVPVGNGEVFIGPDEVGVIAGRTQYGPALDAIHKNAIQLAGPLVTTSGSPLTITTSSLPSEAVNQPYGPVTMTATGGSGSYSWSVTGAPAGLSMSATGVLGGTPTASGSFSLAVSVTSGGVTASATFPVTIAAHTLPLQVPGGGGTTPVTVTGGAVSIPYAQSLPASYGAPPYSWSLLGGTLPTGLSLNSSGTVSGTPTQAGTFAFTAKVTDSSGASASSAFAIAIAPQALTITTTSPLPNGIAGSDYPAQIMTASGGYAPYTFQVTAGGLPGGLVLSGAQINGTPTTSGVFTFTVTVTDSGQSTATASFQITILPAQANLILSQAALSFPLNAGAAGLPAGASISVRSSVVAQLLNYTVSVTPVAPWLDVTGGGTTPGAIGVNLDPKALSLGAGVSQTSIVVACIAPSPCAGSSETINVTLNVTAAAPQLGVTTSLLSFSAQTTTNPLPLSQTLGIENVGGGTITVNSVTAKDSFVMISGAPATIAAGPAIPVTVTVNPTGFAPGYYQSTIFVNTSAGSTNVGVTLFVAQNASMTLSPAGTQFQMAAGSAPGNTNGSFLVGVSGGSAVNWNSTLVSGPNWLTLNTSSGTSTPANPGAVSFAVDPAVVATLAPQAYYATIQVASGSVVDSPQSFLVVLNVAPAANPAKPDPEPAGLLFIASASGALPAQSVQVFASSQNAVNYQASSGSSWLMVSPSTGSTSAASPGSSSVSVNPSGLAPGVYTGGVSYALSSAAVRTVNVTLIVEASAASGSDRTPTALTKAACSPTQLVPTQTGLVNNFAQPTSWPTPLAVLLDNDCGQTVINGQVVATFSNGDPPLVLAVDAATGIYAGTWTPRNAAGQVTVSATATASGFPAARVQITGQVTPNATPLVTPNGTLNVFGPVVGAPVAPGTIVQIYGSNFAAQTTAASVIPLPASLDQTSVLIGGIQAPLYYVSPGQINAQVPFELAAGRPYDVIVSANGAFSTPNTIQLTSDAPGIAQFPAGGIIAQHLDNSLVLETSPAAPGEIIVFYVAGMGLTNQTVPSGTASPAAPNLAVPLDAPTLTLNGAPVTNILFAGMTPTLVGLYQMDFQVPANAPNGDLQLVLTQTSGESNATILPVHN